MDFFKMSNFDFMLVGNEFMGDKIKDTPTNQPKYEDWSQLPPKPQGLEVAPPSPIQVTFFVDKG